MFHKDVKHMHQPNIPFYLLLLAIVIAKKEQMGWKISVRGIEMS